MPKSHRRDQVPQRHLNAAPDPTPGDNDIAIRNRYNEEVRWEILLLGPVDDWFMALCKDDPATADKVEQALDELAISGRNSVAP
jgi:hypothetical protein